MKRFTQIALIAAMAFSHAPGVLADDSHHAPASSQASASPMADGEVRKVDKDAGKITIKHGQIPNLGMANMTMVFRAKDPAMLDQVKAGDKIRFAADQINGAFTVTKLEVAK